MAAAAPHSFIPFSYIELFNLGAQIGSIAAYLDTI